MILVHEGFDMFTVGAGPTTTLGQLGWGGTPSGGNVTSSSPGGRTAGGKSCIFNGTSDWTIASGTTFVMGMAFYIPSGSSTAVIAFQGKNGSGVQWTVYINQSTRAIRITTGADNTLIQATAGADWNYSTWYYLECKVTVGNSAAYEVRLNGSSILSGTADTQQQSTTTITLIGFGGLNIGGAGTDDWYLCDTSGSLNNDFLGDVKSIPYLPDADQAAGWTPSTGATNFGVVDENPPNDDTDYVSAASAGLIDRYTHADVASDQGVKAVTHAMKRRKTDAGVTQLRSNCRSGGSNFTGTTITVPDAYAYHRQVWETDPNTSAAWTVSNLNSAAFGPESV